MKLLFVTSLLSLGHVAFGALKTKPPLLGLCEYDCDVDADCKPGLWCADTHKPELKAAGFDERKANCGKIGAWNLEVCFDPAILKPSGGGGGGTCIITKTSVVFNIADDTFISNRFSYLIILSSQKIRISEHTMVLNTITTVNAIS